MDNMGQVQGSNFAPDSPAKLNMAEFGARIKAKYPQYNDIADEDLGQKMLAKYPQYGDMIQPIDNQSSTPKQGIIERIGSFLGMKPLGEAIGRGLFRLTPESRDLNKLVAQGQVPSRESVIGQAPTPGQVIGSALQTGALAIPGIGAAETLGGRALQFGAAGGASEIGRGLSEQQTAGQIAGKGLIGFGLGAATAPLAEGAMGLAKYLTGTKPTGGLPERLMTNIFKTSETEELRTAYALAHGEPPPPTLARKALEEQMKGDPQSMLVHTVQKLGDFESQLKNSIQNQTIDLANKKGYIEALKTITGNYEASSFGTVPQQVQKGQELLAAMKQKGEMSAQTVLDLKRYLDDARSHSSFLLNQNLAPKQAGLKALADNARNILKEEIPEARNMLNQEQTYIQFRNAIARDAARRNNRQMLTLSDALIGGGGFAAGGPLGALGAESTIRGFQQPFTLTHLANLLYQTGKTGQQIGQQLPERGGDILKKLIATQGSQVIGQ